MGKVINVAVRLIRVVRRAYARKWRFLGLFVFVFFGSIILLANFGLLPSSVEVSANEQNLVNQAVSEKTNIVVSDVPELPTKIEIQTINLSASIANPTTTDVEVLDQKLLSGAVRYPTSAKLGETGNVVLFGHSSYLPIVNNQAYKTFNGIQKLLVGDTIVVYSSDMAYTYQVRSVTKESANDATIPLSVSGKILTLATCNSFAEKSDRFVVVADFVESHVVSG